MEAYGITTDGTLNRDISRVVSQLSESQLLRLAQALIDQAGTDLPRQDEIAELLDIEPLPVEGGRR